MAKRILDWQNSWLALASHRTLANTMKEPQRAPIQRCVKRLSPRFATLLPPCHRKDLEDRLIALLRNLLRFPDELVLNSNPQNGRPANAASRHRLCFVLRNLRKLYFGFSHQIGLGVLSPETVPHISADRSPLYSPQFVCARMPRVDFSHSGKNSAILLN